SFITSKKINSKLQKEKKQLLKFPERVGSITFLINEEKKELTTDWYSPTTFILSKEIKSALEKTGLASRIELRILMHLKKRFPDFKVRSTDNPTQSRIKQLVAHKREVGKAYPIDEAIELIRNYIVRKSIGEKKFNAVEEKIRKRKTEKKPVKITKRI
ncbi:MAG: hypothetical protein JW703_01910, partial [Candidatus Diapherotrites archaeon]|nr:hypothetical protein [Candidatus Diapherotrites archaeon]